MERRLRRGEWVGLIAMAVAGGLILFWPTPVDASVDPVLERVLAALHRHGVPGWFDYDVVEFSANVLLFVPLGAFVTSVLGRPLWWAGGVVGLAASLLVEFTQAVWLTGRTASAADVLANTLGALLGGALVTVALRRRRPRT
ncbi:VanZ family protein [Curtobacterium sp. Leaf261]|uniref:VanZ family protein n=1 Tax=Curtobacterium sp. Leaf261 TaxID=1736311 RepID=UPI0006F9C17A|nr:VanZ family protein [Curtobacterium sp. Leaf261]KQO62319.1 hypothetical protein ASF23_11010 [Curtobacterium sp. Leaf261]